MQIGRRIFYDIATGNVIVDIGERQGAVVPKTIEQDIQTYKELSERNLDKFDYIELEYGQYEQDFAECNGYRINPETKELEFSYPDPNAPEESPIFRPPLSVEVEELKQRQDATENAVLDLLLMGGM